ncbi:hypothetical protein IJ707_00480 [bacterium]|nr:hypothetical protein [bacterium]
MKRLFTALIIVTLTALSANAAQQKENILNEIQIDALKSTYNITLNTTSEADVKRTVQSSDNMILTLKNVKPAKSLNTVYKNAAEVDSIMVEPVGDNNLNIIIKAKNISNSAINLEAEEAAETVSNKSVITPKKQKKSKKESIVLASPVDSYMPVYQENDEDLADDNDIAAAGILAKIKELLSQGNNSNIVTTGLIGIILFCGIKLFKREEPETAIGLAQSLKEREDNLYKDLVSRQTALTPVLTKEPVAPPIVKPSVNVNSGYGLRAYKSSSRNPYMSADNSMLQRAASQPSVQPQSRVISTVGSRVNNVQMNLNINRPVQNMGTVATASNIDSMKFLESMTKIYEKNGRSDLAQGLKAGMLKAKSNI